MLGFSPLWSDQNLMNKPRVADQIVEHIEQLILAGTLRPGDRLPAERIFLPTAQRIPAIATRGLAEIVGAPTCGDTTGRRHLCHQGAYPVTR